MHLVLQQILHQLHTLVEESSEDQRLGETSEQAEPSETFQEEVAEDHTVEAEMNPPEQDVLIVSILTL